MIHRGRTRSSPSFTSPNGPVLLTRIQDSVDTGESRNYWPEESCILPVAVGAQIRNWACSAGGAAAPFQFTVHMFENDTVPPVFPCPNDCFAPAEAADQCEDELIGRATVSLTLADLLRDMPQVGDPSPPYTITLGGPCGHQEGVQSCSSGWLQPSGPEYQFTYRLIRLPDQEPPPINPNP